MRQRKNPFVTSYGRAVSAGTVTRASLAVRRVPKGCGDKPLPIHLQVHPKALSPTPRHPKCLTKPTPYGGAALMLAEKLSRAQLLDGHGLVRSPKRYEIRSGETVFGYSDDLKHAIAWRMAAMLHGIWCDVIDNGERK